MSDKFRSRWSRRKEAARRAGRDSDAPSAAPAPGPTSEAEKRDRTGSVGAEASIVPAQELTPEEIAQLPCIDELTVETDITDFLRGGVPASLRNAALRRMWLLDPAIRDFPGHARDYAYDWNVPGGVPGSGALGPGDDVEAMLRRLVGEGGERSRPSGEKPQAEEAASGSARPVQREGDAPSFAESRHKGQSRDGAQDAFAPGGAERSSGTAGGASKSPAVPHAHGAVSRHGGAKPV